MLIITVLLYYIVMQDQILMLLHISVRPPTDSVVHIIARPRVSGITYYCSASLRADGIAYSTAQPHACQWYLLHTSARTSAKGITYSCKMMCQRYDLLVLDHMPIGDCITYYCKTTCQWYYILLVDTCRLYYILVIDHVPRVPLC